nr:MAG TPA: virion morphogenesis protein [Caudoviricetes sp.]
MSIEAQIIGGETVREKFARAGNAIDGKITESMGRITVKLQAHVVRHKLSGQVLRFRTNNLRGSIHQEVTREGSAIIGRVGTNVEYAAVHEYGFAGTQTVREHLRTQKKAFGRALKTPKKVTVSAHTRQVNYPVRSFLRSAMEDQGSEIMTELAAAVNEVLK